MHTSSALISTEWLSQNMSSPGMVILDGSFKLPGATPTAAEDYATRHIAGALFFDIDGIADHSVSLPHMLPTPEAFAGAMSALGVSNDTPVVVYDTPGLMSAGRVWWTLRIFGHDNVVILDGGLKKWLAEGRPVTTEVPKPAPGKFTATFRPELVRAKSDMLANLSSKTEQVIDARSEARFTAAEKEARPGLRSGHIPGSLNLAFNALTNAETGEVKSPDQLRRLFADAGLDLKKPIVASCGSGVTAAALAFALSLIGRPDVAIYDGAWAEWGLPGETPVES